MADRDGDLGAFLGGLIVGGLIGAAVALLLAPQRGEETREMMLQGGIELKQRAEQVAADLRGRAQEVAEESKGRINDAVDAARQAARRKRAGLEGENPNA